MRYALLIWDEEKRQNEMTEEEGQAQMAGYMGFGEEMSGRGVLQGGERLHPTPATTTVRVRDGEVLTSDGPFAETKEAPGGFYMVDAPDLDTAIAIAARVPAARMVRAVEIRPVVDR